MRLKNLQIAAWAIGLGAFGSLPAAATMLPAPSSSAPPSLAIQTSAPGAIAPGGQGLASSNVELVQRRAGGGRAFRGNRAFRGSAFRGGRSYRGRAYSGRRAFRGGRYYRGGAVRSGRYYRGRGWRGGRYYRDRRYYRGWRGGRYWIGPAIAGTALIIGGSIAASQSRYSDRWDRCAARFRSFRWSDGTYQPYGNRPRVLCPYLRG